jgi:uncharacterized transporter YbjL
MNGVPVNKITGWTFALVALFVVAGTVLAIAGRMDLATNSFGTATGIVVGSATATTVAIKAAGNGNATPNDQQRS